MKSRCKTCKAEIEWGIFAKSSRAVALDLGLFDNGSLVVVAQRGAHKTPVVRLVTRAERELDGYVAFRRAHYHSDGLAS